MSWNYRIMRRKCPETGSIYYTLNEVYYENGKPTMYSEEDYVTATTKEEVVDILEMMIADAKKKQPVLTEKDFKKNETDKDIK